MEKLEQGYSDDTGFVEMEKRKREAELAKEVAEVERKHLAGLVSYEESILAKMRAKEGNAARAAEMKEESKQRLVEMLKEREKRVMWVKNPFSRNHATAECTKNTRKCKYCPKDSTTFSSVQSQSPGRY